MGESAATKCGIVECVECGDFYTEVEVKRGDIFIETMVCLRCYSRMQASSYSASCFGKPTVMFPTKKQGYDSAARECIELCTDRKLCRFIVCG
jgi:hypothetical protein